jgi:hypothetical protein
LLSGTVFLDIPAVQTVNGIFNETLASVPGDMYVESDVVLAKEYGLNDVGYEGGFFVDQNMTTYYAFNGYEAMGSAGYSSGVPNVGMYASLDPRIEQLAINTFDEFYAAGGTLPIVFQSSGNINSWAVAAPTYFDWDTPKQQAAAAVEQTQQLATYGLQPGQPGTDPGPWLFPSTPYSSSADFTYLVPLGTYSETMSFGAFPDAPAGQTDAVELLVDGQLIVTINVPTSTGGSFTVDIGPLAAGQHSVELVNVAPAGNVPVGLGTYILNYTGPATPVVSQATPDIYWGAQSPIVYGTALSASQLDAVANVPGTFTYSPASGAILGAGVDTLAVAFTPTDTTDYTTATATTTITISQATPTVSVTDDGGEYNGAPMPATATVAGVVPGVDNTPAPSLEGVTPTLTYYAGSTATGPPLPGPPTAVGTYTVVASFAGSADYVAATAQTTFTITPRKKHKHGG